MKGKYNWNYHKTFETKDICRALMYMEDKMRVESSIPKSNSNVIHKYDRTDLYKLIE